MKKLALILSIILIISLIPIVTGCESSERSKYDIEITFNEENMSIDGKMKVNYKNTTENSLDNIKFNVFFNAFREDAKMFPVSRIEKYKLFKAGFSYGSSQIISVTNGKTDLTYELGGTDNTLLTVYLLKEIYPNERATIYIDYTFNLCKANLRTGYTDNVVNLGNFYPTLCVFDNGFVECPYYYFGDPFYSECADYNVKLNVGSEYIVASSGVLKKSEKVDNVTQKTYKLDNARDFAFVLSKHFTTISKKVNDIEVQYYYISDLTPENSLAVAVDSINTFSSLFGKYPYKTYSVVQTDFIEGGMEYPGLSFISGGLEQEAYSEVIVHETAHQWWYGVVGNNEIAYGFLDEGLTEYSTVMFFDENQGYGISKQYLMDNCESSYRSFCSIYNSFYKKVDTAMLKSLDKFTSEYEYVNIAYLKGCMLFDNLYQTVGKDRFLLAIREYYKRFSYKNATPYDLANVFSEVVGVPESYFIGWFDGSAII